MIVSMFFNLVRGSLKPFRKMVFLVPGVSYLNERIEVVKDKSGQKLKQVKGTAFRGGLFVLTIGIIIWLAIFIYIAFYYTYVPALTHSRPVHFQFETCDDEDSTKCSFPIAHVQLTQRQQLLMVGQSYKIYLSFDMPESEANQKLGMFMVCLKLNDKDSVEVASSCRPAMLHYTSRLLHIIKTLWLAPLLILGTVEEKQTVTIEMFSDFEEDQNHPVTDMQIELQTKKIELYSSSLQIHAHFTGIRYLMFHWPLLSAIFGVGINLFLICFILLVSWYHLFNEENSQYYSQVLRDKLYPKKSDKLVEMSEKEIEKKKLALKGDDLTDSD